MGAAPRGGRSARAGLGRAARGPVSRAVLKQDWCVLAAGKAGAWRSVTLFYFGFCLEISLTQYSFSAISSSCLSQNSSALLTGDRVVRTKTGISASLRPTVTGSFRTTCVRNQHAQCRQERQSTGHFI